MSAQIAIPIEQIERFCQRHHIQRLALFGSVLRADFRDDSDIDVLVEFEPGKTPDFFTFVELQEELSDMLGRQVDLNTPGFLSRQFRQRVIDTAQVLHERK